MSFILARRLQNGLFEAARAANRAHGTGPGSGLVNTVMSQPGGSAHAVGLGQLIAAGSGLTAITGAAVTVNAVRASTFFGVAQVSFTNNGTAGALGLLMEIDGALPADAPNPIATIAAASNVIIIPIYYATVLQAGSHVFSLIVNASGACRADNFDLYVFQLN
jgi:hypothetical protein